MKKFLSICLVIALIITALPLGTFEFKASAATSGTTGDCTWTLNGTVLTISGDGAMRDYTYSNSSPWGTNITSVIIMDGVTKIGAYAFYKCINLKDTILTDSIRVIGESAFAYCSSIENIIIPNKVDFIDEFIFRDCVSLKSVVIPKTMSGVAGFAFSGCNKLNDIYYCGNIKDKNFPIQEGNYYFGYYAKWHYNIIVNNSYRVGDIDDNTNINLNDLISISQFIADWDEVSVNYLALDVNDDNEINLEDVTHFARYLAGWDVTLH